MQKVILPPVPGVFQTLSDFSLEPVSEQGFAAPVEVSIKFNYGSACDGESLDLDLSDGQALPLLELLSRKITMSRREEVDHLIRALSAPK